MPASRRRGFDVLTPLTFAYLLRRGSRQLTEAGPAPSKQRFLLDGGPVGQRRGGADRLGRQNRATGLSGGTVPVAASLSLGSKGTGRGANSDASTPFKSQGAIRCLNCSAGSPYPGLARLLLTQGKSGLGTRPGTEAALAPSRQRFGSRCQGPPGRGCERSIRMRPLAGQDPPCYVPMSIQMGLRPHQPALTGNGGDNDVALTGNSRSRALRSLPWGANGSWAIEQRAGGEEAAC